MIKKVIFMTLVALAFTGCRHNESRKAKADARIAEFTSALDSIFAANLKELEDKKIQECRVFSSSLGIETLSEEIDGIGAFDGKGWKMSEDMMIAFMRTLSRPQLVLMDKYLQDVSEGYYWVGKGTYDGDGFVSYTYDELGDARFAKGEFPFVFGVKKPMHFYWVLDGYACGSVLPVLLGEGEYKSHAVKEALFYALEKVDAKLYKNFKDLLNSYAAKAKAREAIYQRKAARQKAPLEKKLADLKVLEKAFNDSIDNVFATQKKRLEEEKDGKIAFFADSVYRAEDRE